MARSRKLWTPPKKRAAKPERKVWTPERGKAKPVPAPSPNKSKRVLADLSKLKPAREEHGWRFEDIERQRRKGRWEVGERWTCDYLQADGTSGCKSFVWKHKPEPGQYHAWDCPYWQHEGKDLQPF